MGVIERLRGLDDRLLGDRRRAGVVMEGKGGGGRRGGGAVAADVLSVALRISRLVLLGLAVVVLLGIAFTKAPTNASNVIVRNVLDLAREAAGPFRDVFAPRRRQDALVVNYLLAAGVYLVAAYVVGKLPTGKRG